MKLYLVQHGLAKSSDEDPERPLTELGWTQTKKIATLITAVENIKPKKIFHSGKTRAKQTAELIAQHLEMIDKIEQVDGLAPKDEPAIWGDRIGSLKDDIMMVGHLPHLSKLAAKLVNQDENKNPIKFQNSGILCLEQDDSGFWVINWMIVPEILP